jgi:NitT/TauT family transport system substrate-binding protein
MHKLILSFAAVLLLLPVGGSAGAAALKIGILPVLDTLPLQVGVTEGLFEERGIEVELVPFASAMERDMALQAGQLDGYFGDLPITLLLIHKGVDMRIATTAFATSPGQRMFALVAGPGKGGKKSMTVGISTASIIEYLLTRIEERGGAGGLDLKPVEVKKIPIRMQMLLAGQLDAALLPEPLATLAERKGGTVLATDEALDMTLTVVCLHNARLSELSAFLQAYGKAVERINADPERYRELMARTCRIPPELAPTFPVYRYPAPGLPTREEVEQTSAWMVGRGMIPEHLRYEQVVPAF